MPDLRRFSCALTLAVFLLADDGMRRWICMRAAPGIDAMERRRRGVE